eukprot:4511852-Amphidinium_carterae.1
MVTDCLGSPPAVSPEPNLRASPPSPAPREESPSPFRMQVGCQQPRPQTPVLSATFDNFGQTSPLLEDRRRSPMLVDSPLAAQLPPRPVGEVPATAVVEAPATPLLPNDPQ